MFGINNNDEAKQDSEKMVTVVYEEELSFEYTEHIAEVAFTDGSRDAIRFDEMSQSDGVFYFSNYLDEPYEHSTTYSTFVTADSEKFLSMPVENVKTLETVERISKEKTTTVERSKELLRSEAEEFIEDRESAYIK